MEAGVLWFRCSVHEAERSTILTLMGSRELIKKSYSWTPVQTQEFRDLGLGFGNLHFI